MGGRSDAPIDWRRPSAAALSVRAGAGRYPLASDVRPGAPGVELRESRTATAARRAGAWARASGLEQAQRPPGGSAIHPRHCRCGTVPVQFSIAVRIKIPSQEPVPASLPLLWVAHRDHQHPRLWRRGLDEYDFRVGAAAAGHHPPGGPPLVVRQGQATAAKLALQLPRCGVNATRSRSLCGRVQRPTRKSTATPPLNHIGDATLLSARRTSRTSAG
jgi:hypothetical protein